jgi:LysM repeat protein
MSVMIQNQQIKKREKRGPFSPSMALVPVGKRGFISGIIKRDAPRPDQIKKIFRLGKIIRPSGIILFVASLVIFCIFSLANAGSFTKPGSLPVRLGDTSELESFASDNLVAESNRAESTTELSVHAMNTLKVAQYRVKSGESVSSIAKKFKLNIDTLVSYNNIKTVHSVIPETMLGIPNTNGLTYRVGSGDCLTGIASRYKVPLNSILDWNDLKSDTIKAGTALFIPGARMSRNELNKVLGTIFIWPVRGIISSPYGYRIHPIDGSKSFHNGLDIAGNEGTPIKAAMAGKVLKTGKNFLYGNYIILGHDDGFQTLYGHLSAFECQEGKYVDQGAEIGKMGNTGYSTGDHLHFTVFKNGETVDPLSYLK